MPKGDGTGPLGKGSMTGKRAGRCAGNFPAKVNNNRNQQGRFFSLSKKMFSDISKAPGRGHSMGHGMRNFTWAEENKTEAAQAYNRDRVLQDTAQLKENARQIEKELNEIQSKIKILENKKISSEKILVDKELCTGCRTCKDVCPRNAILVRSVAEIDHRLCTLCGRCVNECPVQAMRFG